MDTWTSISKIRTAKAEFLGSFRALDILLPQNSALAVLILEIDVHVSIYLLLSGRTLADFATFWSLVLFCSSSFFSKRRYRLKHLSHSGSEKASIYLTEQNKVIPSSLLKNLDVLYIRDCVGDACRGVEK